MGLKHLPFINIVFLLLNILIGITFGGESLSGRLKCLGFWLRGERKMLTNFAMVIEIASISGTWQNNQLLDFPLSHNYHKRNPQKDCCIH